MRQQASPGPKNIIHGNCRGSRLSDQIANWTWHFSASAMYSGLNSSGQALIVLATMELHAHTGAPTRVRARVCVRAPASDGRLTRTSVTFWCLQNFCSRPLGLSARTSQRQRRSWPALRACKNRPHAMIRWLAALVASSFTFALADVLCDICSTRKSPLSNPALCEHGLQASCAFLCTPAALCL